MNRKMLAVVIAVLAVLLIIIGIVSSKGGWGRGRESALYQTAFSLQTQGDFTQAVSTYQELIKRYPNGAKTAQSWYQLAEIYEKENKLDQAKSAYASIVVNFPNFQNISEAEKKMWNLNVKILFSADIGEKDIVYKVEPGDTLGKIAAQYNTTVDLIKQSNKLQNDIIRPGNRLKISRIKFEVLVDKSQSILTLKGDDEIFKVYSVATGKNNGTPVGTFNIVEKLKDPDWYRSGVGVVTSDSPENILGARWLGLSEPQYGIHGGATEKDLGQQVTNGCVRMLNEEVVELFTILPRGTEVTVAD